MTSTMQNHVRPSKVMWIPLVLVGSVLYWSLALGLGGMSLSFLGDTNEEDLALRPTTTTTLEEPIVVHLQSKSELGGAGGITSQDDGTGRLPGIDEASPSPPVEDSVGRTSY
jgi:hypothetical protein